MGPPKSKPTKVKVPPAVKDRTLYIRARAYAKKSYPKHSPFRSAYTQRKYTSLYLAKYGPDAKPYDDSKRKGGLRKFFKTKFDVSKSNRRRKNTKKK